MDVTATFLEGAILSWALPLALLIVVTIWWVWLAWGRDTSDQDS